MRESDLKEYTKEPTPFAAVAVAIIMSCIVMFFMVGCTVDSSNGLQDETSTRTGAYGVTLKPSTGMYVSFETIVNVFGDTMACMGMTAQDVTVQYVSYKEYFNGAYGAPWGGWIVNSNLVFVNTDDLGLGFQREAGIDKEILRHEFVHYILYYNGADPKHGNPMFAQCGLGVNTYN